MSIGISWIIEDPRHTVGLSFYTFPNPLQKTLSKPRIPLQNLAPNLPLRPREPPRLLHIRRAKVAPVEVREAPAARRQIFPLDPLLQGRVGQLEQVERRGRREEAVRCSEHLFCVSVFNSLLIIAVFSCTRCQNVG